MIVPMKKVSVIVLEYEKKIALRSLRKAGLLHISDIPVRNERSEDMLKEKEALEKASMRIEDAVAAAKASKKRSTPKTMEAIVDSDEFSDLHAQVMYMIGQEKEILEQRQKSIILRDQLNGWGDFSPLDIQYLRDRGMVLNFYKLGRKDLDRIRDSVDYVLLSSKGKIQTIAIIGNEIPEGIIAEHLNYPSFSLSQISNSIEEDTKRLMAIERDLLEMEMYLPLYKQQIDAIEQDIRFETVSAGMGTDDLVAWLSGFIPAHKVPGFKELASREKWGYLLDEPSEEDQVPTLIRNSRLVAIIKPVFDIMGTVPGYREFDISMWFLMFFSLFFAMIVGDAAYGVIFLLLGGILHGKTKKATNAVVLIYTLSIFTIIWGSLTGTWFGSKAILEAVPFLKSLVIPQISNYPELFGLTATSAQNTVMQFCFIVGTLQLSLACAMNILRKIPRKDLSALADVGWLVMIDALYFLVLMLVINASINMTAVAMVIASGFLLVVLFSAQGPGIPFLKGLAGGAAGLFTTFLNSISAFSNIISYIRLFAVGMASLAIAQSFNNMASGLLQGFALPAGILVLVIGHGLNLVMALLSVVVHGVRLNLLEFSGQLGMEWTGVVYDPFRETVEESQTL
jgi:V/A-type H+/Na+-transporting ATPase subunit I